MSGIYHHHLFLLWLPANLFVCFFLVPCNVAAATDDRNHETYQPLSCGQFHNINCPFTLKGAGNPYKCSFPVELVCDAENRTIYSVLPSQNFSVIDISYENQSIRIVDPGLQKDNCSSIPRYSLSPKDLEKSNLGLRFPLYYMDCTTPVDSPYYVDTSSCIYPSSASSFSSNNTYSYVVSGATPVQEEKGSCKLWMISGSSMDWSYGDSYFDIHSKMSNGIVLVWMNQLQGVPVSILEYLLRIIGVLIIYVFLLWSMAKFVLGTPFVIGFLIYTFRRRRRAMDPSVEDYLHDYYSNQMPIRYSYNDVKRMANNFKEKLGQGGYGSVFKGVLSNKHSVAIKIMTTTKGNGQEFINEVASIGRIHHVNVVRLIGFVAERSKRALVYEFMPNGSLEKYIFPQEENITVPLSWMKMFEIALGIARGIDYLHRGCEMQILHFDIKPHNILLDENFIPKISDFGLAKLYTAGDSIVSMTAARGTIGYLAPELLFRNIGGVSYKSDVYSFGVMLLEMAGRRKNINAFAENPSQIYFPTWIYDRLNKGKDIEMEDITDEDQKELAKKMIMVGLWCIQMKPIDRPSMLKVIEMLEGDLELLQMPPKPNVLPDEDGNAISID